MGGGVKRPAPLFCNMAFNFTLMDLTVKGMRDMNPVSFTYKGVKYSGFRDVLNRDLQMSLYGAHDAVEITVGVMRSELKANLQQGEEVRLYTPELGRKGRVLHILGIREDAGGLTARMDLEVRYNDE